MLLKSDTKGWRKEPEGYSSELAVIFYITVGVDAEKLAWRYEDDASLCYDRVYIEKLYQSNTYHATMGAIYSAEEIGKILE